MERRRSEMLVARVVVPGRSEAGRQGRALCGIFN